LKSGGKAFGQARHSPHDGRRSRRSSGDSTRDDARACEKRFWVGCDESGAGRLKDRTLDVMKLWSVNVGCHGVDWGMSDSEA
jgi:hypothetical protein